MACWSVGGQVDQPESRGRPKAAAGLALASVGVSTAPRGATKTGPGAAAYGSGAGLLARGCRLSAQQLRQLGEVCRRPPRLVAGEQLRRRSPTGLVLEVEVAERLPGAVADDEAGVVVLLDRPGRREAAHGNNSAISAARRKRRSAILRRRDAMGETQTSSVQGRAGRRVNRTVFQRQLFEWARRPGKQSRAD